MHPPRTAHPLLVKRVFFKHPTSFFLFFWFYLKRSWHHAVWFKKCFLSLFNTFQHSSVSGHCCAAKRCSNAQFFLKIGCRSIRDIKHVTLMVFDIIGDLISGNKGLGLNISVGSHIKDQAVSAVLEMKHFWFWTGQNK